MAPASVDVSMGDAQEEVSELIEEPEEQRIRILPGSSETAASFEFKKEDHTLGNALRYIIMKNPDVEFCGYSIPHPSEAVMNIRIQTYENTSAVQALEKGLDDLIDLCDIVDDRFRYGSTQFDKKKDEERRAREEAAKRN